MSCEPWPVLFTCEDPPSEEAAQYAAAVQAAQSLLYGLTGSRLGTCTVTERYRPGGRGGCGMPMKDPSTGLWRNGGRGGSCCALELVNQPVQAVTAVRVFGVLLGPGEYAVEGAGMLHRRGSCWPAVADCDTPPIEVTYTYGIALDPPVPADPEADPPVAAVPASPWYAAAALAMGELVAEFYAGSCGKPCKLPSRVASITRQGVTVNFIDPETWFQLGLTGLPLTDSLIRLVNPGGQRQRSRVYSSALGRRV